MKSRTNALYFRGSIGVLVTAVLAGCAGVDFYSAPDLTKKTGIPIYGSKPYVLVVRTQAKDKPVDVSIQYLTDRSQVIYAVPHSGFGSADLKLSLDHGQLTQFGQVTDAKIPELINAVGGLLTSRASAIETLAKAEQIKSGAGSTTTQSAKIPDTKTMAAVRSLFGDMTAAPAVTDLKKLDQSEQLVVGGVTKALRDIVDVVDKHPEKTNLLPALGDQLIGVSKDFAKLPDPGTASSVRTTALQRIATWKPRLDNIVEAITPEPATQLDFELYEIQEDAGGIHLRRVQ